MYTDDQEKIARVLLKEPLTIEQLRENLDIPASELLSALKGLITLKVVEKDKDKYKLIEKISTELNKDIEKKFKIRMILEGSSSDKEAVTKQMDILTQKLKTEPIAIESFNKSELDEQEQVYSQHIDTEFWTESFENVIKLVINYGPTIVEVLEPQQTELNLAETQSALNELASGIHYYSDWILKYELALQELTKKLKQSTGIEHIYYKETKQTPTTSKTETKLPENKSIDE